MASAACEEKLEIRTVEGGFYRGFNPMVALASKLLIFALVALLIAFPAASAEQIDWLKRLTIRVFAPWYIYLLGIFVLACGGLVLMPVAGRMRLGKPEDKSEYSTKSWLAMMFCAGIGIGILVFSVSEPISHFMVNPDTLVGNVASTTPEAVPSALRFTFLHWGVSAWCCYAVIGLALGLTCHTYDQPMTMRSALVPLFGRGMERIAGDLVDVLSILAIIAGITTTIVLGLEQICSGLSVLTGSSFFADHSGSPPLTALLSALVVAIAVAMTSVVSGVERGVKWISNTGVIVAFGVMLVFLVTGPVLRLLGLLSESTLLYVETLPRQIFTLYSPGGGEAAAAQAVWQADWTIFYWAWWIAFAPFVGLFLARISRGRTVREFILGAVIGPMAMCFVWFAVIGGSALLLETDGIAQGRIVSALHAFRVYEVIDLILYGPAATVMKVVMALLFLLLIVASSSAAIIAIKSIGAAGGDECDAPAHSMIWALVIAGLSGAVMAVGGVTSIRDVMIIGAVPFSFIMALMLLAVARHVWSEVRSASRQSDVRT